MIYLKYSGSIGGSEEVRRLQEEMADICAISGWKYEMINENFDSITRKSGRSTGLKSPAFIDFEEALSKSAMNMLSANQVFLEGIAIKIADDMDPVTLSFDGEGKLATIALQNINTQKFSGTDMDVEKLEIFHQRYIKIYTGTPENHKVAVRLLDYLGKKYIKDLDVTDTSFYWERRDEEELRVRMWKSSRAGKMIY